MLDKNDPLTYNEYTRINEEVANSVGSGGVAGYDPMLFKQKNHKKYKDIPKKFDKK